MCWANNDEAIRLYKLWPIGLLCLNLKIFYASYASYASPLSYLQYNICNYIKKQTLRWTRMTSRLKYTLTQDSYTLRNGLQRNVSLPACDKGAHFSSHKRTIFVFGLKRVIQSLEVKDIIKLLAWLGNWTTREMKPNAFTFRISANNLPQ